MFQNLERLNREQPIEITAEVQGNYPNFKQNLAWQEIFTIWKVSKSQPIFEKNCLRAARSQKLTTRLFNKKQTKVQTKNLPQKQSFPDKFCQKNGSKGFLSKLQITWTLRRHWLFWGNIHTWGNFAGDESRSENIANGKNIWKNISTPRVLWPHHLPTTERTLKRLWLFFQAVQGTSRSLVYFFCLSNRTESLWNSRKLPKKTQFRQLLVKEPWEKFARSLNLHQNSLLNPLPNLLLNSNGNHLFDARWTR